MHVHPKIVLAILAAVALGVLPAACDDRKAASAPVQSAQEAPGAAASRSSIEPAPQPALVELRAAAEAAKAPDTTGRITEFALPSGSAAPGGIAAGADGNLWVAETGVNKIARVTPAGEITEFPLASGSLPAAVAAGPDGNLWFAQRGGIGFITPAGAVTTHKVDGIVSSISPGPDGNLWFTENFRGKIGRATPAGQITLFDIPTRPGGGSSNPHSIVAGPDGNLWFTESNVGANKSGASRRPGRSRSSRCRRPAPRVASPPGPMATCGSCRPTTRSKTGS